MDVYACACVFATMKMAKVPTLMMIAFDKLYKRKMNFKTYTTRIRDKYNMYDDTRR